jgi:hypothetical protein
MTDEKLKSFLEGYANLARDREHLKEYAPFKPYSNMAHGSCGVADKNGHPVLVTYGAYAPDGTKFEYDPSMPIMPHEFALAGFICDALNALYG